MIQNNAYDIILYISSFESLYLERVHMLDLSVLNMHRTLANLLCHIFSIKNISYNFRDN